MSPPDHLLTIRVADHHGVPVIELDGVLARRSGADLHGVLRKVLLDRGRVLVDAERLRLTSPAGLTLFPTVLARVGGWPEARLVVVAGPGPVAGAMRVAGCAMEVPVAADRARGLALLECRPARVRRTTSLPRAPEGIALARALCTVACEDWAIDAFRAERLVLVTNELVANAVQHTWSGIMLSLTLDATGLRTSVRDGRAAGRPVVGGGDRYGMRIVDELSDGWGVTDRPGGKSVWALFRATS